MSPEFDGAVSQIRQRTIEQVVVMLETCGPVGEISRGLTNLEYADALMKRLRALRGKLHGCEPNEWRERHNALQAQEGASGNLAPSVSNVRVRRPKAQKRKRSVARARSKKTGRRSA